MKFGRALIPFLVGTKAGSSSHVDDDDASMSTQFLSSSSPSDLRHDIHKSIGLDSIRNGKKNQNETKHFSVSQIRAMDAKKKLQFIHSPKQLENQYHDEDNAKNDVASGKDDGEKNKATKRSKQEEDRQKQEEDYIDDRIDNDKLNMDIDSGHLRRHHVSVSKNGDRSSSSSSGEKYNDDDFGIEEQNMHGMTDVITKQHDVAYADDSTLPFLSYMGMSREVHYFGDDTDEYRYHYGLVDGRNLQTGEQDCDILCPDSKPEILVDGDEFRQLVKHCVKGTRQCPESYGNVPIGCWNTSGITNMNSAFEQQKKFNEQINCWDVSSVTDMGSMFQYAYEFNRKVNNWNVGRVTTMKNTFNYARDFNQQLRDWDVSSVNNMYNMFYYAMKFNKPINEWNVSNVSNMFGVFGLATKFDQEVNDWDVSRVTQMGFMFTQASIFNKPISDWNVGRVTSMYYMFDDAGKFNQELNDWNLSAAAEDFSKMFYYASEFNQCLSSWAAKTPSTVITKEMFFETSCPNRNVKTPDPSTGPWCQGEKHGCSVGPPSSGSTAEPTPSPTEKPTSAPVTAPPTASPTSSPIPLPTLQPTLSPTLPSPTLPPGCKDKRTTNKSGFLVQTMANKPNRLARRTCSDIAKNKFCGRTAKLNDKFVKARDICERSCNNCPAVPTGPTFPTAAPATPACKDDVKSKKQKISVIVKSKLSTCVKVKKNTKLCKKRLTSDGKKKVNTLCQKSCGTGKSEKKSKIRFISKTEKMTCKQIGKNKKLCNNKLFSDSKKAVKTVCKKSCGICP